MSQRKYFLDWLRVLAFAALILFHVGMLYVSWSYNLKSPQLHPEIEPVMNALSAWRLALLFVVSGVAARFLIDKLGPGAFALDRLRRLLPVILFGMWVVIPPQTYVMLVGRGLLTNMDYLTFWWTQYLPANQTLVAPLHRTMPTWDHLWFLIYLMDYALLAAGVIWVCRRLGLRAPSTPAWLLMVGPAAWLVASNLVIALAFPITDGLTDDWGGHLKWGGLFVIGLFAARQDRFWTLLEAHRGKALATAAVLLAIQLRVNDPLWSAVSGLYAWAAICALCGFSKAWLNHPSALLAHLNEAVLPIYVLHQPILLIAAFWLFPLRLPAPLEAATLAAITYAGCFAIYETLIRPLAPMRFLFGLKAQSGARSRSRSARSAVDRSRAPVA